MEKAEELEFLQYFYSAAGDCFGPADAEVYDAIKHAFTTHKRKALPEGYELREED